MAVPSYAKAAAGVHVSTNDVSERRKDGLSQQVLELCQPEPQAFTLTAALHLLAPLSTQTDVFLIPRSYLQNWLIWAFHQPSLKAETPRVEAAMRLAAEKFGLKPPQGNMPHAAPGPIDALPLAKEDEPLLLKPDLVVVYGKDGYGSLIDGSDYAPGSLRRVKSMPDAQAMETSSSDSNGVSPLDFSDGKPTCCAVPEKFYEALRMVHGVICADGLQISFQATPKDSDSLIYHDADEDAIHSENERSHALNGGRERSPPVEFRRKVIISKRRALRPIATEDPTSPMTKLLQKERELSEPLMVPIVEVYPIQINYKIQSEASFGDGHKHRKGMALVSRKTFAYFAIKALLEVAAPLSSSSCKRLWTRRESGTCSGDGYELVELDYLDGKLRRKEHTFETPQISMGDWLQSHNEISSTSELDVIVETRTPNVAWSRIDLELANRVEIGDFVDAQDDTGKWYEALVREVALDSVKVHYFGWASKWDGRVRRRNTGAQPEGISPRLNAIAPLWSQTRRWRQQLKEGSILEVRDSASLADRPRWYKGEVRRVSMRKVHKIEGGAKLETFEQTRNGEIEHLPLILLGRSAQILVEVEEEREKAPRVAAAMNHDDDSSIASLAADPPALRWVSLYGEEICKAGTHMKLSETADANVATLRYALEHGRKPVEIMKSFNNMYGAGFVKESMLGTPPAPGSVGLHNLGNSCFLNSIIQCLNQIEPLTRYFVSGPYAEDLNKTNPLGSGGRVATAYASLLRDMWSGKYSALAPRLLKQTVASFAPQFNNSYQHDSQEFCQFLMDGLHEDCNRVKTKPYVEELEGFGMEDDKAAIETWRKHLLRHDSIVVDHCQGMHRSHLTCPGCGRESIKFDVYSTISLPLAQEKERTALKLEDCIEKFMEGEQLDEMNAWYCPSCKRHVCALKMIALWSVPDVLILHLKRFTFEHDLVTNHVIRSKIDDNVKFPIDYLDLRKYVLGPFDENAPPVYKLFGVSEHMGVTANSGHYTATVRNSKDGRWYRYNDAHVGETTGDASVTGGAYVLFFQRIHGTSKWAGMEKVMKDRGINPYGGLETDQEGFTKVATKKNHKAK